MYEALSDRARGIGLALAMHLERLQYAYIALGVVLIAIGIASWWVFIKPTSNFPVDTPITIAYKTSITAAGEQLHAAGYIDSVLVYKIVARAIAGDQGIKSGAYAFTKPVGVVEIVWNLSHGISGLPTHRLTFPEGTTVRQMSVQLGERIPNFDAERFRTIALPAEGYLFPDTYFFLPSTTEEEAMNIMRANYEARMDRYSDELTEFGRSEHDVIIMASLLEAEGKTLEDRRIIAGILWKRIQLGMPLQVDATFGYIHGVTGYTPTAKDLASDSAYNTYRYKGLPPTAINNPGEESIRAAFTPRESPYLYYLTGTDGRMHYAKTFAEHVANKKAYLQ